MVKRELEVWLIILAVMLTTVLFLPTGTVVADSPQEQSQGQAQGNGKKGGGTSPLGWREDFNDSLELIQNRGWKIEDSASQDRKFGVPGYIPETHIGFFERANVSLVDGTNGNKYLCLRLSQEIGLVDEKPGVISRGALIYTQQLYGYGTYEWRMRMSSTTTSPEGPGSALPGNVSAAFTYVNNSEAEIDFEFAGHVVEDENPSNDETLYMANWYNRNPSTDPLENDSTFSVSTVVGLNSEFKTYKFEWKKNGITFYVDGVAQVIHRTDVPSASAHILMNHWGTNRQGGFGGTATPGVDRYFYIDWFQYTPAR